MFFFFPAGLVLYWLTNNILSIAQQWIINKRLGCCRPSATAHGSVLPRSAATPHPWRRRRPSRFPRTGDAAARTLTRRCAASRMLPRHHDPIVAIATAPGRGAVGIVRVSGRDLAPLVHALFGRPLRAARRHLSAVSSTPQARAIDRGLALHFPAPHSYTGEDVLELQAHGGPVRAAAAAGALPGSRGQPRIGLRLAAAAASSPSAPF